MKKQNIIYAAVFTVFISLHQLTIIENPWGIPYLLICDFLAMLYVFEAISQAR
jgi:hypothetical protein